jgi:hypothetical protein
MFGRRHLSIAWFLGLMLLALAHVGHAYEHWEIVAHNDCVAHADGGNGDGGSRHDHGCTSHDHAPALADGIYTLTVSETVATASSERPRLPLQRGVAIDHPPQLS